MSVNIYRSIPPNSLMRSSIVASRAANWSAGERTLMVGTAGVDTTGAGDAVVCGGLAAAGVAVEAGTTDAGTAVPSFSMPKVYHEKRPRFLHGAEREKEKLTCIHEKILPANAAEIDVDRRRRGIVRDGKLLGHADELRQIAVDGRPRAVCASRVGRERHTGV